MQQAAPPAGFDFRALSAFAACPSTLPLRIGHITIRSGLLQRVTRRLAGHPDLNHQGCRRGGFASGDELG
jgi:hypothetical protein